MNRRRPPHPDDPRVQQLYDLLQSLLAGSQGATAEALVSSPWHEVPEASTDEPWLVSATDLLTAWSPQVLDAAPVAVGSLSPPHRHATHHDTWDTYFAGPAGVAEHPGSSPQAPPVVPLPQVDPDEPEFEREEIDDATATAVVDCLYDFVHALGRREIDQAMACVDLEFHSIENDEEIDRTGLRQRFEHLLDTYRRRELEVSLTSVPEPVAYRGGLVLIPATLQIDFPATTEEPAHSITLARVAILSQHEGTGSGGGGWKISGLGPRPDLEHSTIGWAPEATPPA